MITLDDVKKNYYGSVIKHNNLFYVLIDIVENDNKIIFKLMSINGGDDILLELVDVNKNTECNCHYDNWVDVVCPFTLEKHDETEPLEDCEDCLGKGYHNYKDILFPKNYEYFASNVMDFIRKTSEIFINSLK